MLRLLIPLTLLIFLSQILFSLFYSNQIIDLNQQFQDLNQQKAMLELDIQNYELSFTQNSSLDQVEKFSIEQNYQKINQFIDLSNPINEP